MQITPAFLIISSEIQKVQLTLSTLDKKEKDFIREGDIEFKPFIYDKEVGKFVPIWGTTESFSVKVLSIKETEDNKFFITLEIKGLTVKGVYGLGVGLKKTASHVLTNNFIVIPIFSKEKLKLSSKTKIIFNSVKCYPKFYSFFSRKEIKCELQVNNAKDSVAKFFLVGKLNNKLVGLYESGVLLPSQLRKYSITFQFIDMRPGLNKLDIEAKIYGLGESRKYITTRTNLIVFYFPWYIVLIALVSIILLYKLRRKGNGKDKGRNVPEKFKNQNSTKKYKKE